jgi:hypothetical protein
MTQHFRALGHASLISSRASIENMDFPMWRHKLEASLALNKTIQSRWPQLSTLSVDGNRPCTRTIAFRGFLSDVPNFILNEPISSMLVFVTDKRSAKFEEIRHHNQVALCWYLPDSREQYRFSCKAHLLPHNLSSATSESLKIDPLQVEKIRNHFWTQHSFGQRPNHLWILNLRHL